MGLISVRLDDEDERFIRRHHLRISDVVREAVHARVHQMRGTLALDFLASASWKPEESAQKIIRRLRDARSVRS